MSEQLGTCNYGSCSRETPHEKHPECKNWKPVPAPAEPVAGETKRCKGCAEPVKLSKGAFWCATKDCPNCGPIGENQMLPAPAVAAPAEGKPKRFTDGERWIATADNVATKWGGDGKGFKCGLCGHRFVEGEGVRWVYANGTTPSYCNFFTCDSCDGSDVLERRTAAGKFADSLDCDEVVIAAHALRASTPSTANPAQEKADDTAFEQAAKERERGELVDLDDIAPADLEGKLRELRQSRHISALCSPGGMMAVLREAAALGRAEGLNEAAKVTETINSRVARRIASAIRALKEKV